MNDRHLRASDAFCQGNFPGELAGTMVRRAGGENGDRFETARVLATLFNGFGPGESSQIVLCGSVAYEGSICPVRWGRNTEISRGCFCLPDSKTFKERSRPRHEAPARGGAGRRDKLQIRIKDSYLAGSVIFGGYSGSFARPFRDGSGGARAFCWPFFP